jgi:hypothetical protein
MENEIRDIHAEEVFLRLLSERGETEDDIIWQQAVPSWRPAGFEYGVIRTKGYVYTIVSDFWDEGGMEGGSGYYPKVFVSPVGSGL